MAACSRSAPCGLRINLLDAPTCVSADALRFSFLPGCRMSACRVVVAEGASNLAHEQYIYDSGRMETDEPTGICPPDLSDALAADRLYYARVAVWDEAGLESPLSSPLPFHVAGAHRCATGIWAPARADGTVADFAFFRHVFRADLPESAVMARAYLAVTALSPEPARQFVYRVMLNGTEVGVGPCRLGKTPTGETTIRYAVYDVTHLMQERENVLAALCYTTAEHAFHCRLVAYDSYGMPHLLAATGDNGDTWLSLDGDEVFGKSNSIGTSYFTAHACNVDATRYPFGFDRLDHTPNAAWQNAAVIEDICNGRALLPDESESMRHYPADSPVTVTNGADGAILVDLGAEIVGGLRLTLNNPTDAPVTVTLDYAEQLIPDGAGGMTVKFPMNTGNRYRETWTLKPGMQTLETFSMMTYRYVRIVGLPAPLAPADVVGTELRKGFHEKDSRLVTDQVLLADLWHLTRHTVRVTTQDIYVDSQSRERGAYEGDLYINMLAAYAHEASFAPARLTTDYLLGHRTWPADYLLCIIYAARADYMATGDDRLLAAWYDTLKRNLFADWMDETGLIKAPPIAPSNGNAILVDWPPSERDGYDMGAPYNTVLNALNVRAMEDMAFIADALGRYSDAAEFRRLHDGLRTTMLERLYDPAAGRFRDGLLADGTPSPHMAQHATAYALWAGVYRDEAMANRMAEAMCADGKLHVSVYAAFFLLEGLYRAGRGDLANRLMLDEDDADGARTWAYMIRRLGATVTTEAWNEKNKPNMTLSHPWGAAPAHMIAAGICGIKPTAPGYATVDVSPSFDGVDHLDATLPTIRGGIRISWQKEADGTHTLTLALPPCMRASVRLPGGERVGEVAGTQSWAGL